eukprot:932192-Prorocentrum_minimum.AAC.1
MLEAVVEDDALPLLPAAGVVRNANGAPAWDPQPQVHCQPGQSQPAPSAKPLAVSAPSAHHPPCPPRQRIVHRVRPVSGDSCHAVGARAD